MAGDLSIKAFAPLIAQSYDDYEQTLQTDKEEYVLTEGIGQDTASFYMYGPEEYLKQWYAHGLVRDIHFVAPDSSVPFRGWVGQMTLSLGNETQSKSILNMANRVTYVYAPEDTTTNPPTTGAQTSIEKNNANSQTEYGVKEVLVSGKQKNATAADDEAWSKLKQLCHIDYGYKADVHKSKAPALKVSVYGYAHMMNWFLYSQTASSGTDTPRDIVAAVVAADPNNVLEATDIDMDDNATLIEKYQDGKKTGWQIIQMCAEAGYETGSEGWPWTVAVYGRRLHFKQAEGVDFEGKLEATNQYKLITKHVSDVGEVFIEQGGRVLRSWELKPDRLVKSAGIPGDPVYVTQVRWKSPGDVTLDGRDSRNPLLERATWAPDPKVVDGLRAFYFHRDSDVTTITDREFDGPGTIPVGGIIIWSGAVGAIPTGWALCDGNNGTPDLTDRFVIGAGDSYAVGATGGSTTKNLAHAHGSGTLATDSDSHTHGPGTLATDSDSHTHGPGTLETDGPSQGVNLSTGATGAATDSHTHSVASGITASDAHSHDVDSGITGSDGHSHSVDSGNTGSGGSATQNVMNPYYSLCYIMRTA